ncbi:MAG: YbjN domain-containing protein [Deltaproteobacteria bacterium]|jgi:hypothetical protein|nr:YbjN domain-containing protein [Deltaproteobacteria bacterium]
MEKKENGHYIKMVNEYLKKFGKKIGVDFRPVDAEGSTTIQRGSAKIGINVIEKRNVLLFLSYIMDVPEDKDTQFALYRKLLELNFMQTADGAFALDAKGKKDRLYLRALRILEGLDYEEFRDLLNTVAKVADEWDDKLIEDFAK